MSAQATQVAVSAPTEQRASYSRQVASLTRRNLTHIKRMPEMLLDVTLQPVMFVLLFAYVFGGSIAVAGSNYREWLIPGIVVQTMTFASLIVALGLNNDLGKGIIDRFRSLPIHSSAVLVARSVSALIHSLIGIAVMAVTGLLIGWRIRTGVLEAIAGLGLLLLFGLAMIWVGIWLGSVLKSPEAVNSLGFVVIFPLTFLANAFAPSENMPNFLRPVAEWNPISALVQALRDLWGNGEAAGPDAAWPLQNPEIASIVWSVAITAVIAPLAVRTFQRRTSS